MGAIPQQQLGEFKLRMICGPVQGRPFVEVACVRAACVCNQMVAHVSDGAAFSRSNDIGLACDAGSLHASERVWV